MFKNISTIILTVLCLLSCSEAKDDIPSTNPDVPPTPDDNIISFSSTAINWHEGETSSRATGLETQFNDFQVYGYKNTANSGGKQIVMNAYKVQWDEETDGWKYILPNYNNQQMKIWDFGAKSYRFFALAPYNHGATVTEEQSQSNDESYLTFTTKYDYANQEKAKNVPYCSELWYSLNETTDENNTVPKIGEQVKLVFLPLIAKVRFRITFAPGVNARVTEPTFQDERWTSTNTPNTPNTPMQWDFIVKYPTIKDKDATPSSSPTVSSSFSPTSGHTTGKFFFDTPFTDDNQKWYYVPPMADAPEEHKNNPFVLTAKIDGHEDTAIVPADYMQWKAGNQYTYVFKVLEAGTNIIFDGIEVEKWERNTPIDNQGHGTGGW